jgi:hypothetical protein
LELERSEIWPCDGRAVQFIGLAEGGYLEAPESLSFPGLTPARRREAIDQRRRKGQTAVLHACGQPLRAR